MSTQIFCGSVVEFNKGPITQCRHIDCAKAYQNQTGLGKALTELYSEGKVSRKDFWLTTKLWNTDHAEVRKNCLESMKELQTDYLDLYLVHWPVTQHKGPALTPSMKVSCDPSVRVQQPCRGAVRLQRELYDPKRDLFVRSWPDALLTVLRQSCHCWFFSPSDGCVCTCMQFKAGAGTLHLWAIVPCCSDVSTV